VAQQVLQQAQVAVLLLLKVFLSLTLRLFCNKYFL